MKKEKKGYSPELSEKVTGMMKVFIGKDLEQLPIPCLTKWIGGTLTEVERGVIEIEIKASREMTNPAGYLHGGIQCAMIDDAMGWACATLGYENQFLSTNLNVDYLGTAKAGDTVRIKASIYREGSTLLHAVGEIRRDKTVIAKAQSNLYISGKPVDFKSIMGV
ncbi:MAG TPA: PaaI family thioesterase [Spirochaetota bacterium]|nr:PaaI family thioesterase [Spirochaetota bacterium]HPJ35935.1 PaaI family thioesterase [Spirochaetota bacterium]